MLILVEGKLKTRIFPVLFQLYRTTALHNKYRSKRVASDLDKSYKKSEQLAGIILEELATDRT